MKKYVIMAHRGSGKTTLAERIIKETDKKVYGFFTRKYPDLLTEDGLCPIYIYPAGGSPLFDDAHLIGLGGKGNHYTNTDVFDTIGVSLLDCDDKDGLIIMDEIGFLEMNAEHFKKKVFEVLSGDVPVILMLKAKLRFDFLKEISVFPGVEFIYMDETNRNEIYEKLRKEFCV